MAQIIRTARGRLRDSPSSDRKLRSSDAPGTLLNVAMLNLASDKESLRLGAYNVVSELCQFYKWDAMSRRNKACGESILNEIWAEVSWTHNTGQLVNVCTGS